MTRFVRNRRDGNHGAIVEALEAAGVRVVDLSDAGGGVPDIACWVPPRYVHATHFCSESHVANEGRWVFIEIKQRRGRLRKSQEEFRERYPVVMARTAAEALAACGIRVCQ